MGVAPLRLRFLAALVDAAVVISGFVVVVGLGIAGAFAYRRVRGGQHEQSAEEGEEEEEGDEDKPLEISSTTRRVLQSPELRSALSGAAAGISVASRNWRDPGFRVLGLRRVDARTGGVVTVRSALVGFVFDQARQATGKLMFESRAERRRDRVSALGPQLRTVERKENDDPQAHQQAVIELNKANGVKALAGCGRRLAGPVALHLFLALGSGGGRTVRDRITGTSVVIVQSRFGSLT